MATVNYMVASMIANSRMGYYKKLAALVNANAVSVSHPYGVAYMNPVHHADMKLAQLRVRAKREIAFESFCFHMMIVLTGLLAGATIYLEWLITLA